MKRFIEGTHMCIQLFMQLHAHIHTRIGEGKKLWNFWENIGNGRILSSWFDSASSCNTVWCTEPCCTVIMFRC